MNRLDLSRAAFRFLQGLPPKPFRQVTLRILDLLKDPYPHDSRQLTGYEYRRIDVGEYRVVYRVESDTVKVALVGKRNDDEVYERLRLLERG